jgi:hypothetical protein
MSDQVQLQTINPSDQPETSNESYPADGFTAMTFCFPGFEDDMVKIFDDCVQNTQ